MGKPAGNKRSAAADAKTYGVPDWKAKAGYPENWDKLDADKKKWEFLRRTQEYRNDWDRTQLAAPKEPATAKQKFGNPKFDGVHLARKYKMSHPVAPNINYTELPKSFKFIRDTPLGGDIVFPRTKSAVASRENDWEVKFATYAYEISVPEKPSHYYDGRIWVELYLDVGIDKQIDRLKNNFNKYKTEAQKFMLSLNEKGDADEYVALDLSSPKLRLLNKSDEPRSEHPEVTLLRIMDAKTAKYRNAQIINKLDEVIGLAMDESNVSKKYNRAKKYWKIL